MKKVFKYWIDTYYLFSIDLFEAKINAYFFPEGYSLHIIKSKIDPRFEEICSFWGKAYSESPERSGSKVKGEVELLFQHGDVCFCIIFQKSIVGMAWSGDKEALNRMDFAHLIKDEENIAIGHHGFIDEKHRGQGLQRLISLARLDHAKNSGYHKYYVFAGVKNMASIRNLMNIFTKYKIVFHLKIDVPFRTFNFYPQANNATWALCQSMHVPGARVPG